MKPEWIEYDGEYEKEEYAIILKITGDLYKPCWPNAGKFHVLGTSKIIDGKDVYKIRPVTEEEHSWNLPKKEQADE